MLDAARGSFGPRVLADPGLIMSKRGCNDACFRKAVADRGGADYILVGSMARSEGQQVIRLRLIDVDGRSPDLERVVPVHGTSISWLTTLGAAVQWMALATGAPTTMHRPPPPPPKPEDEEKELSRDQLMQLTGAGVMAVGLVTALAGAGAIVVATDPPARRTALLFGVVDFLATWSVGVPLLVAGSLRNEAPAAPAAEEPAGEETAGEEPTGDEAAAEEPPEGETAGEEAAPPARDEETAPAAPPASAPEPQRAPPPPR